LFYSKQDGAATFVRPLDVDSVGKIESLKQSVQNTVLGKSVLYAMKRLVKQFNKQLGQQDVFGINIGSSRGITELFEKNTIKNI
jgi:hypothetical protein